MTKSIQSYYSNAVIIIICLLLTLTRHHHSAIINGRILFTDYVINQSLVSAMVIDNSKIERVQIGLTNCSFLNTVDAQASVPLSSSTTSIMNSIDANFNYTFNSFELQSNYFSVTKLNDLFCNENVNISVLTHTTYDCDEYQNKNLNSNSIPVKQIICLSTSLNQIVSIIKSFLQSYNYTYYSVIYSNINQISSKYLDYYQNLANNLVYKLSVNSFILDFIHSISNPGLLDNLTNSKATSKHLVRVFFFLKNNFFFLSSNYPTV